MDHLRTRALRLLLGTFVLYGVLVATHEGEFWPFSIFPMFSQAGGEWSRAVVREVAWDDAPTDWEPLLRTELPGEPLVLTDYGLRHDLANFIARTERWDDSRVEGLRRMLAEPLEARSLLVYRVRGRLADGDNVRIRFIPYAYLAPDTTVLRSDLP
ncbi:MAG: hypothetical protein GVY12_15385 [Bacteroidetes bacterium]|jgi:hypothetical protein|nr:hypothetical protein [Bacteroidota bacterium]